MPVSNPVLRSHLEKDRMAHTYLFTGPEGSGKISLVESFAKALNCEKGKRFEPCDCLSCRKIEKKNHPDVKWLGDDPKARSIKIEEVRNLLHEASLRPYEGKWKVFVLQGADRLTIEAANALLKTLEEPPEHSVFFLLVENKAHVLPTIESRACEVKVPPAPEKDISSHPLVQLLDEGETAEFFEKLKAASRAELDKDLEILAQYFRDRCAETQPENLNQSRKYLEAMEWIYEVQSALDSNVNQKLALTRLEIDLEKVLA